MVADDVPAPGVLSAWAGTPLPAVTEPLIIAKVPLPPIPESLPMQQPGLAQNPSHAALDKPDVAQGLPSTFHASAETFSMPQLPTRGGPVAVPPETQPSAEEEPGAEEPPPSPVWTPEPTARQPLTYRKMEGVPAPPERGSGAEQASETGHPVGRWLSRMLSFGRKPAQPPVESVSPAPTFEVANEPVVEEASAPTEATQPAPSPTARPDISEPHALPASMGGSAPPLPAPAPLKRGGLAAAGLEEILGGGTPARPRVVVPQKMEGLTAVSAASGPLDPSQVPHGTPDAASPGAPPYPMLDVTPPTAAATPTIEIEREPVPADPSFGIPRLPQREAPKPVRAPVADTFVVREAEPALPIVPIAPVPTVASTPRVQGGPPPLIPPAARPVKPAVPEPPADFLAEFAASLRVEPVMDPTAPAWKSEAPAMPEVAQPPALPPALRGTPVATRPTPTPPPAPPAKPAPPLVAPPTLVPPLPQAEAPVLRAPSTIEPIQLAAADVAALMRELPLPTPSAEMARPAFAAAVAAAAAADDAPVPEAAEDPRCRSRRHAGRPAGRSQATRRSLASARGVACAR